MDYQRVSFEGADCTLSALDFGGGGKPPLIIVHGMRDHALSLLSVVEPLAPRYRVVVPDLRGHGDSENSGSYAMTQFIADLRALVTTLGLENPVLIGHSLGGHIVTKYAGIFPGDVAALVLIDGMGPPRIDSGEDSAALQANWRRNIDTALGLADTRRQMKDESEAVARLRRNNPGLAPQTAGLIVRAGVERHPDGGIRWKWDPRVGMVWGTFDHRESERQWQLIPCPVLMVTGDRAMDYWRANGRDYPDDDLRAIHAAEQQRRVEAFADARHVEVPDAGHMVHYDQPYRLNRAIQAFLETLPA